MKINPVLVLERYSMFCDVIKIVKYRSDGCDEFRNCIYEGFIQYRK